MNNLKIADVGSGGAMLQLYRPAKFHLYSDTGTIGGETYRFFYAEHESFSQNRPAHHNLK